jgi:hypothetical protein
MKIPTFLYHAELGARLFELDAGAVFPEGWHDAPPAGAPVEVTAETALDDATRTIADLNAIIDAGMAENRAQAATIADQEARIAELEEQLAAVAAANRPARGRPRKDA